MSKDKRSVSTDALETLGTLNLDETAGRDAIHLAVEPVIAGEYLGAGEHIGIVNGRALRKAKKKLGIVDPFLPNGVEEGDKFWLIVYPRQITSLRHVWSHPDFPETGIPEPEEFHDVKGVIAHAENFKKVIGEEYPLNDTAIRWMSNYAESIGLDFHEMMDAADNYQSHGERLVGGEEFEGLYTDDEFWDYYAIIRNKKTDELKNNGNFFSCAC